MLKNVSYYVLPIQIHVERTWYCCFTLSAPTVPICPTPYVCLDKTPKTGSIIPTLPPFSA